MLGIFGLLLLLGGAGLGYYAYRSGQPKSKLKGKSVVEEIIYPIGYRIL